MFYKIFCSPISTKELRKTQESEDILAGNIFAKDGMNLGPSVYRSLLETVALHPKKKHFKKIVSHLTQFENKENVESQLIDLITFIGIDQKYPVFLGQTMKFLLQNDYAVTPATFKSFVLFLERCKGFEEDAKRFVVLTSETKHV